MFLFIQLTTTNIALLSDIAKEAIRSGFSPPSVTGNEEPTITCPENKIQIIF